MLEGALRRSAVEPFVREHAAALAGLDLRSHDRGGGADPTGAVRAMIAERFGFEWTEFSRFGWDDPRYGLDREESVFRAKALLRPEDLDGRIVLDAGCGNGRYAHWATRYGGRVMAVDLGGAVDAAARNLGGERGVQVVEADIFDLPFAPDTFDVVFSIGVLMHTGDTRRAAACLVRTARPGGSVCLHVYGRGNRIYEAVDGVLRSRTTRLPPARMMRLAAGMYRLRRGLDRVGLGDQVGRFVRLDPHPACIFDWYAAPVASHHTYPQVEGWLRDLGVSVVATARRPVPSRSRVGGLVHALARRPETVTIRGVVSR